MLPGVAAGKLMGILLDPRRRCGRIGPTLLRTLPPLEGVTACRIS